MYFLTYISITVKSIYHLINITLIKLTLSNVHFNLRFITKGAFIILNQYYTN